MENTKIVTMKTLKILHLYVENREPEVAEEFIQYSLYKTVLSKKHMILCDFKQKTY
eukprot:TRINITY_DN16873_c0_g1_i1.p2 TRINITY_DN16873_c0_g1~~TRINITY_DN16873_c0_g1_i1.p2  ORF type:complete len:56 (-),score=1.22 TRINITY_DN16873_c0_g1_i1:362-529(-)